MNKATCRGCGARIVWIKTPAGKAMPCDPAPVYYKATPDGKDKVVTTRGEVVSCEIVPGPTPPTPATGHTGPPARRPTTSREGPAPWIKSGYFRRSGSSFDEAPKRMCDETGRAELERELEEGINRDITIMLGYQPPILIKPVIALNKEARSAVLEELKIVPTSTDYIAITVNMEGGADHE